MDNMSNELLKLIQKAKSVYSPNEAEYPFTTDQTMSLEKLMKIMGIKK